MRPVIGRQELICREMRIFLRRRERGVPQHFLNGPEIGPFIQEMRGIRMPQRMRADRPARKAAGIPRDHPSHTACRESAAAMIDKERGGRVAR